jgi:hypothetical protein
MEYQVPQFIEVEDKIFGPFTLKQFIYVAGGIGLCAILILYLPIVFGVILAIPVAAFSGALAFYKVNNKNFVDVLESGFRFYTTERLYLWKRDPKDHEPVAVAAAPIERAPVTGLTRSRLHDLAWSLDVKDTTNQEQP